MRPEPLLRIGLAALACTTLLLGLSAQPAGAQTAGSGFLSDYARLGKAGPVRDRYLSYTDPELTGRPIRTLCILPVRRFPADARFDGVDDALADDLLARADAQLRARLGGRFKLTAAPEDADATLQVALTAVIAQPEGKTALDLVPLRLVTGPIKDKALGKTLEAAATLELRLTVAGAARPWRESLYQISGKSIGRADDPRTRISVDALVPAIDRWAASLGEQIAAQP